MSPYHLCKWPGRRRGGAVTAAFLSACVLSSLALGPSQVIAGQDPSIDEITEAVGVTREGKVADSQQEKKPAQDPNNQTQNEPKKAEWVLAPIPMSNPAVGTGLVWAVGRIFPLSKKDTVSPPSTVGTGGLITNNGSRAMIIGGILYLKEDRYRVTAILGGAKINADVYGVGKQAGDRGIFLPVTGKGGGVMGQFLFRLYKNVYLGARSQYRNLTLSLNKEKITIPNIDNPPPELVDVVNQLRKDWFQQTTVAIGPKFQWDTRDNTFYPRRGHLLDTGIDLFSTALGSKFTYQNFKIGFNKYTSIGKQQVIAFRGMGCASMGDRVPIYDLCMYGSNGDLRGYSTGRYQDRRMFATQAEYRLTLPLEGILGRFGVAAFGGFGGVAPRFSDMAFSDFLPAGGGGLRFRMTKSNPINFRVDYGVGRSGHTWTLSVGEAF